MATSFQNPGREYRPAPFWSWNGDMEPGEVRRQIGLLHEQGFGGFFMHSRVGLKTPYMGEEWMAAVAAGVEAARELNMEAWLYDEDKWPSGFAGGAVPAKGAACRAKGLEARLLTAGELAEAWSNPDQGVMLDQPRLMFAVDIDAGGRLNSYRRLDDPPAAGAEGRFLLCQVRVSTGGEDRFNGESYVDLMDPAVTQAFLESTHEKYKERFAASFGSDIPGIFTDEPTVSILAARHTPWTPALPQAFAQWWGYDLLAELPLLFIPGENSDRVRHDYWATVTRLFRDNFSRLYGEWCERNGLLMTGHYLAEDNLEVQILHSGAPMPHYVYMQLPGIDHLCRNINNPLTLKQVSSVAHQTGRTRVLCEIFGVCGHSMSFADQKWIADFHFTLGITFLNQHLTLYSMVGERKRDYPANISWAQPYWPAYKQFNDYAARCSWFIQRGRYVADILLLHPVTSAWALMPCRCQGSNYMDQLLQVRSLNNKYLSVFDGLLADHRDFDLGDELVMADLARVEGDCLRVGEMSYRTVVLPYCARLEPQTAALLQAFLAAGGRVYAVGSLPSAVQLPGVKLVADVAELLQELKDLPRPISICGEDGSELGTVLYQQRVDGNRRLFFLANTDQQQGCRARVTLPGTGTVTVFDPTSGQAAALAENERSLFGYAAVQVQEAGPDELVLLWDAPPAGSLAFSVGDGADPEAPLADADGPAATGAWQPRVTSAYPGFPGLLEDERVVTDAGPWPFRRLHSNVITLDFCRYALNGEPLSAEQAPVPAVRAQVLQAAGRTTAIQPWVYISGKKESRPVPVELEFTFHAEVLPPSLALVVEQPRLVQVTVNGRPATKLFAAGDAGAPVVPWLADPGFGALDIAQLAQLGENRVRLAFTATADGAEVEEIYLAGDFGVWQRDGRWVIGAEPATLRAGSWVDQGYPFYSGTMRYELQAPQDCVRWLDLSQTAASLLQVAAGGGPAVTLPWRPWVVDFGSQSGVKKVEVDVVSSLRNAFGPLHHKEGDNLTWVGPGQFNASPEFWTDEYQFTAYGILGPVRWR